MDGNTVRSIIQHYGGTVRSIQLFYGTAFLLLFFVFWQQKRPINPPAGVLVFHRSSHWHSIIQMLPGNILTPKGGGHRNSPSTMPINLTRLDWLWVRRGADNSDLCCRLGSSIKSLISLAPALVLSLWLTSPTAPVGKSSTRSRRELRSLHVNVCYVCALHAKRTPPPPPAVIKWQ